MTASVDTLKNTYTYNTAGNLLTSKVANTLDSYYLYSTATADSTRNHTASVTDVNSITTTYNYNEYTGITSAVTDAKGTKVQYTYHLENERPNMTFISGIAAVTYQYESNGYLNGLKRKTFDTVGGTTARYQCYTYEYNDWGQTTSLAVSASTDNVTYTTGATLIQNEYYDLNVATANQPEGYSPGALKTATYGNGDAVSYYYDKYGRPEKDVHDDTGDTTTYVYNGEGALSTLEYYDKSADATTVYRFEYDSLGRLIRSSETADGSLVQRTEHVYDAYSRMQSQSWIVEGDSFTESYTYNDPTDAAAGDGSLASMTTASGDVINYTYDNLKRLRSATAVLDGDTTLYRNLYAYKSSGTRSSLQVEYNNIRDAEDNVLLGRKYEYDAVGNISVIYDFDGSTYRKIAAYTYDVLNQLSTETIYPYSSTGTQSSTVYTYTYDTAGNLLTVAKNGSTTKTYTYGRAGWHDLLTKVNGSAISYDASGNPTAYANSSSTEYGYLRWEHGRQLAYLEVSPSANLEYGISYAYDSSGIRTQKIVETTIGGSGSVTHNYITQNGKVIRETIGSGSTATVMDFIYDESGRPVAVPEKIFGLTLILDFFDRCHSLASLAPPPAAVGSLPLCSEILRRRRQELRHVLLRSEPAR